MLKIIYLTSIDLSIAEGCSINENEFLEMMERNFEDRFFCVLQKFSQTYDFNLPKNCVFFEFQRFRDFYKAFKISKAIHKLYVKENIDLIVTRMQFIPIIEFFLIYIFGCKVYIRHAANSLTSPPKGLKNRMYIILENLLKKVIYRWAIGMDSPTPQLAKVFINQGIKQSKIKIIENGTNVERFIAPSLTWLKKKIPKDTIILGFAGLQPTAGGALPLIKAAKILIEKKKNILVLIIGIDKNFSLVLKEAYEQEISEHCIFLGNISYQQISKFIELFSIGFCLIDEYITKANGNSSQKIRQYLAAGKPVICMREGNDFIDSFNLGSRVDVNNIQEIADETLKWIKIIEQEGDDLAQRLHHYAKEHLSTEKTFQQRLEFWQSLLKETEK